MGACGLDIPECQAVVRLENLVAGNLASEDPGEDIAVVVAPTHGPLLPAFSSSPLNPRRRASSIATSPSGTPRTASATIR